MENHVLGRRTRALWTCPVLFRARSSSLGTWPLQRVRELACLPLCAGRAWYRSRLSISNTLPANATYPALAIGIDARKGCIRDAIEVAYVVYTLTQTKPGCKQRHGSNEGERLKQCCYPGCRHSPESENALPWIGWEKTGMGGNWEFKYLEIEVTTHKNIIFNILQI